MKIRTEKVRVKTARGRKISSKRWLERQLNDPYVQQAKKEGYRSRAAYKLLELNEKHKILKPAQRIIDLGAAPGGWLQVAAKLTQSSNKTPAVFGIDLLAVDPVPGAAFLQLDFMDDSAPETLLAMAGGKVDGVISDMAPNSTGHSGTDHLRIIALVEAAVAFAYDILKPGGFFIAKVWQGGTESGLLTEMKKRFTSVSHAKPKASRSDSAEVYVVAKEFRG